MSIVCNICDNFNISKLICSCKNNKEDDSFSLNDIEFNLVETDHKKYDDLLPTNDNYIYLKITKEGKIIAASGKSLKEMPLSEEDILDKKLEDIDIYKEFFVDFIRPLYDNCIKNGEAYQFDFKTTLSEDILTCSLYPCSIPNYISSVDLVIRYSRKTLGPRISDFAIKKEKVPILN